MLRVPHRVRAAVLGLTSCAVLGAAALAAPSTALAAGTPAPAHLSGQTIALRQLPLLRVANEILGFTGQGRAVGYSGYGNVAISVPDRSVTLYWHGSEPAALRRQITRLDATAPVKVVAAPYTWQQLQAQTRRIAARERSLMAAGYRVTQVGPEPAASGLAIGIDYARSPALAAAAADRTSAVRLAATASAAVRRLVPGTAPLQIADTPLAAAAGTRNLDDSPWWGASRIVRPGDIDCSTGFSVVKGSAHYMLTAGHCGGINTSWQTGDYYGSGSAMGTETSRNPCCDSAIIGVAANQGWIYDKDWEATAGEAIIGAVTAVDGTYICTEGATSGVRCNIETLETGQVVTFTNEDGSTFTSQNESLATQRTAGLEADAGGDSGGAAIVNSGTTAGVYATGTISGGSGSVSCTDIDPNVVPACYPAMWFEQISSILSIWGVSLVTG